MAYYGGTRNPKVTQTNAGTPAAVTVGTNPCSNGTDPGACSGSISSNGVCATPTNSQTLLYPLSGYAFLASNPDELVNSLESAITSIQAANYSFSAQASVAAARVQDENFIYEASFEPQNSAGVNKEPFWTGHLKKYQIGSDGKLITPYCWDAGVLLNQEDAADRNMWTYKSGSSLTPFDTTNITAADLAITGSATQTAASVVGFYRGDLAYNLELVNSNSWKLGDLFHTNPVVVKTPQQFFYDPRECDAPSFAAFRTNHQRTAANGNQLIIAGANDGQLHSFHTGSSSAGTDCSGGGDEDWSFFPPNLLQKLSPIAHYSHADRASLASHNFFIDGPIQVFDAWIPSSNSSGISKSPSDWKTVAVFGEGQGSGSYLWSSSPTCYSTDTTYFSATFSTTLPTTTNPTQYYCGLYALDVTDTTATSPNYMWHLMPTTAQAPYLGEAWSKMQIGRVNIGGNEKWVGFIGGGYDSSACLSADGTTSTACNTPATGSAGKGFFVVDLRDGSILWSYTHANNSSMDFSAPASPLPLDTDSDGFIDTVYMGDLGGNMWRFRLCPRDVSCSYCGKTDGYTASPCTSCSTSNWTGSLLFTSTPTERGSGLSTPTNTHKQIFTQAIATKDPNGKVWVYFGTGENNDPTTRPADTSATKNRIYAIKDSNFTTTYTSSNLTDISSTPLYDYSSINGWYKNLSTNTLTRSDGTSIASPTGEKMISDMALFNNILYFSTYIPDQGTTNACGLAGDTFEYLIDCFYGLGVANATDLAAARAAIAAYQAAAAAAAANPGNTALAAAAAAALAAAQAAVNNTANDNTKYIGHGIGSSMLVSYRPGYTDADIYVTASGGAGTPELTQSMGQAPKPPNMTNVLYWKDRRMQ
jgi:type IV pilus assembly protein PilY1